MNELTSTNNKVNLPDIEIFFFAQALDNEGADDWYKYENDKLKIVEEIDQVYVSRLMHEYMADTLKEEKSNTICSYKIKNNNLGIVFLIDNQQKDKIGRKSKTALIIKNYPLNDQNKDQIEFNFESIIMQFWKVTNRNNTMSIEINNEINEIIKIIKKKYQITDTQNVKKNIKKTKSYPKVLIATGLITIVVIIIVIFSMKKQLENF